MVEKVKEIKNSQLLDVSGGKLEFLKKVENPDGSITLSFKDDGQGPGGPPHCGGHCKRGDGRGGCAGPGARGKRPLDEFFELLRGEAFKGKEFDITIKPR